jgi:hypothetical protein
VNHYLKHTPETRLSWINSQELKASMVKRLLQPKVLAISAGCLTGLLATAFIGWMYWNTDLQTKRLAELEAKFEQESKVQKQLSAIHTQTVTIGKELTNISSEIQATTSLLTELTKERSYRRLIPPLLLKTLALSITPHIVLSRIDKTDDLWKLTAQTTDNRTGNEYIDSLNHLLQPLDYQVTHSSVSLGEDQLYHINVSMNYQQGLNKKADKQPTKATQ